MGSLKTLVCYFAFTAVPTLDSSHPGPCFLSWRGLVEGLVLGDWGVGECRWVREDDCGVVLEAGE